MSNVELSESLFKRFCIHAHFISVNKGEFIHLKEKIMIVLVVVVHLPTTGSLSKGTLHEFHMQSQVTGHLKCFSLHSI